MRVRANTRSVSAVAIERGCHILRQVPAHSLGVEDIVSVFDRGLQRLHERFGKGRFLLQCCWFVCGWFM